MKKKETIEWQNDENLINELVELKRKNKVMKEALEEIKYWRLPDTNQYWDKEETQPMSFEALYGSNGARDYIKSIAEEALLNCKRVVKIGSVYQSITDIPNQNGRIYTKEVVDKAFEKYKNK